MSAVISPNMSLVIPGVGTEAGPQYATDVNNSLTIIDSHDHSAGNGVQVTPAGLNINSALPLNNQALQNVASLNLTAQVSSPANSSVYAIGVDLYFLDGNGNSVRVTQGGALAGTPGSIANLVSPASASYVSGTGTFVWQSDANTAANLDAASVIIRKMTASSPGITIAPPSSLSSDYTISLPALPASTLPVMLDVSGNLSTGQITLAQLVAAVQQALIPAGTILSYGANDSSSPPAGYFYCNGQAVSRSTYAALWNVIGTNFGNGDGSTTFNVPDLRGLFPRGKSDGSGRDPAASSRTALLAGGNTGDNTGSYQTSAFQSHTHSITDPGHLHFVNAYNVGGTTVGPVSDQFVANPIDVASFKRNFTDGAVTGITGTNSTGDVENRPQNVYVLFIIKY